MASTEQARQAAAWLERHIEAQDKRCHWCLETMLCTPEERHSAATFNHPLRVTLEHLVPRSRGGADTFENTVAACLSCNMRKGSRMPDEFVIDEISRLCDKLAQAKANGDPEKYLAAVSVAEAHRIAALLRELVEEADAWKAVDVMHARAVAAEEENAALRAALAKYGRHYPLCAAVGGCGYCDCGLEEVRSTFDRDDSASALDDR